MVRPRFRHCAIWLGYPTPLVCQALEPEDYRGRQNRCSEEEHRPDTDAQCELEALKNHLPTSRNGYQKPNPIYFNFEF
ncbi:MAG TPA: hypothetical protein VM554_03790 [Acidisarcina sp.]|nr:hypothetical protein [Acidisarcina sp.]